MEDLVGGDPAQCLTPGTLPGGGGEYNQVAPLTFSHPQDLLRWPASRDGHGGLHTLMVQTIDRLLELLLDIPTASG